MTESSAPQTRSVDQVAPTVAYWSTEAVLDRATRYVDSIIALNVRYGMGRCDAATRQRAIQSAAEQAYWLRGWPT